MSIYKLFDNNKVFILGHRGYSAKYPENTMLSFLACVGQKGVDGVELDVHMCKSGEIVIAHDGNLKRICGLDRYIEDMNWEELRLLDAGIFKGKKFEGTRMPLLEELFKTVGKKMVYDIELKLEPGHHKYKKLCQKTWDLIQKYNLENHVMVSSFYPFALRYFNKISWLSVPSADIYENGKKPYFRISNSSYLKPEFPMVNKDYCEMMGKDMISWTVNTKTDANRLLKVKGTKGLIGNDPILLAQCLESVKKK